MTNRCDNDWINGRVAMIMGAARCVFIAHARAWLAEAAGDLALQFWAMRSSQEDALIALEVEVRRHFLRRSEALT